MVHPRLEVFGQDPVAAGWAVRLERGRLIRVRERGYPCN